MLHDMCHSSTTVVHTLFLSCTSALGLSNTRASHPAKWLLPLYLGKVRETGSSYGQKQVYHRMSSSIFCSLAMSFWTCTHLQLLADRKLADSCRCHLSLNLHDRLDVEKLGSSLLLSFGKVFAEPYRLLAQRC